MLADGNDLEEKKKDGGGRTEYCQSEALEQARRSGVSVQVGRLTSDGGILSSLMAAGEKMVNGE